ncbi:MAG: precorrin-6y C5,15-methyltransferase (decarboxylating) subunit CbiE [Hyphomicrobiales bacterium]|nr:precorrin-6y C5,15-methyltransferase (decarboxylating) subunit CbiE [Hyphomicrobiales bacterium]MDE2018453.1 precorrin-6y C5,15-methyltransferase (decarboxylating) subunit CbiE [Hyphomicrobiales bacterium]
MSIVGIGEDGRAGLSPAAARALDQARIVWGGRRHLALAAPFPGEARAWPSPPEAAFAGIAAARGEPVCVLASGDPFHYGIGAQLARAFAQTEIAAYPAPSSFSLAAARLGWPLQDCALVSVHGRPLERLLRHLQPGARVLALSDGAESPARIAALLAARGLGASRLHVCERLGGSAERLRTFGADETPPADVDPLNLVAIEVATGPRAATPSLAPGLPDDLFENDGQITRADVRALTLAALAPRRGEILWDVGAGSGSVAIEWTLRDPAMRAVAIERDPARAARIARNARALGAPDLRVIEGDAPAAFAGLPAPDAIFVGGGAGGEGMIETAIAALKPGGRLVVNAVTLETQALLASLHAERGGGLTRIDLAEAAPVGRFRGFRAGMTIVRWRWDKP